MAEHDENPVQDVDARIATLREGIEYLKGQNASISLDSDIDVKMEVESLASAWHTAVTLDETLRESDLHQKIIALIGDAIAVVQTPALVEHMQNQLADVLLPETDY